MLKGSPFCVSSLLKPERVSSTHQSRGPREDADRPRPRRAQAHLQVGTTIPRGPCRGRDAGKARLRSVRGSGCVVPANSCGSTADVESCVPWRRLTQPSCPSCLSFITGGFSPTPSTIVGSTMAEVMEAGSGVGSGSAGRVRRFWEGTLE